MTRSLLIPLFATVSACAVEPAAFTLKTLTAQMKYDTPEMFVQPGQPVKIVFENNDDLPHNLVFCQPGTDTAAMALKQMDKPEEALKRNWLPDDPRIWAHSKMLNPHKKQELTFTAPEKTGNYPYVCTFPGHALTMRGEMKVMKAGEGLHDLTFALYLGKWQRLPDFQKLKPHREGKVESDLIEIKLDDYKNEFGVVFTGRLNAPKKGLYRFFLSSDDGARIFIDDKELVTYDGIHPASEIREQRTTLEKGAHTYRLEYFQGADQIHLYAAWKGPGFQITPLSKWRHPDWRGGSSKKSDFAPIPLVVKDEPLIYRNFIQGAGNRAIGVGYPGGINIAWSAESMNLALIWRGAFIDASRHWNSRGGGYEKPLGYDVLQPTGEATPAFFITDKPDAEWPKWDKSKRYEGFAWKGYSLDARRFPAFRYTWHDAEVEETFSVEGNGNKADGNAKLIRTIKVSGKLPANAWYRIGSGQFEGKDGVFIFKNPQKYRITAAGAQAAGSNLVIPAKTGTMTITYQWAQ